MPKIVNTALKAKAKAWTFEAKATGPEAKAKAIKFGLEAKAWPRGLHHWVNHISTPWAAPQLLLFGPHKLTPFDLQQANLAWKSTCELAFFRVDHIPNPRCIAPPMHDHTI